MNEPIEEELRSLAEDVLLASDQYKAFAQIWDKLTLEQKKIVRRLASRARRLIRDLCSCWGDYELPDPYEES